jgi:hypothetical protein
MDSKWAAKSRVIAIKGGEAIIRSVAVIGNGAAERDRGLAVQMIPANDAAAPMFLRPATRENQDSRYQADGVFTEQLEALERLEGMARQQKVTVEHIHVHQGGQAIVGAVNATQKGGAGRIAMPNESPKIDGTALKEPVARYPWRETPGRRG